MTNKHSNLFLNNNFAIDNTLEEYELKTATNADDVILRISFDTDGQLSLIKLNQLS